MEHPYKTLMKQMKAAKEGQELPRLLLLFGRESFLVRWSLDYIKSEVISPGAKDFDMSVFSEGDTSAADIIAACETLPVMSQKRLVIVEEHPGFSASGADGADDVKLLSDYLKDLPPFLMLCFVCEKPAKTRSLYKAVSKYGICYDFVSLDEETLVGWMAKKLRAAGKTADPRVMLEFARSCGYFDMDRDYTLCDLDGDIKKAVALSDGPVTGPSEFAMCSSAAPEANAFALLDSAFSKDKGKAFELLRNSVDLASASKQDGVVFQFIGLMCSQLEIMVEASERQLRGQKRPEIEKQMGINPYRLKKAMETASKRSPQALKKNLYEAYGLEETIKNGIMPPRLALEMFIASL